MTQHHEYLFLIVATLFNFPAHKFLKRRERIVEGCRPNLLTMECRLNCFTTYFKSYSN